MSLEEMMVPVRRIAHASFETPDPERLIDYYTNVIGLSVIERDKDATYLASLEDHAVVIRRGAEARCVRLAFQIAPDADLADFEKGLTGHGVKTVRKRDPEPGIPEIVTFEDPKGTVLEVFRERTLPKSTGLGKGISPFKLGHVAFNCVDVKKITNFYCDVLGFRVSDWFGEIFSFLRCGPDHHTINLLDAKQVRMNHIAFELRDWSHLQTACDFLSHHGYTLIWGPGRHGPGHNLFSYHKNPDGHVVELFAELDHMNDESLGYFEPRPWHRDRPQRPKVWPLDPMSANLWGIGPPHEMME
jgi:catechol 2,3-dioxygenase-like lactoylglutathione lyase family enzyme